MAADPWNNPTGPGGDPFGIPTYDYTNPYGVTTGTSSSTLGAPPTPEEFKCYFESDWFMRLVRSCCKTLYIPPAAMGYLPMDYELGPAVAPAAMGMPYGTRFRYYVGRGNDLLFNGGDDYALEFINRYFGFDLRSVPTDTRFVKKVHTYVLGDPNPPREYVDIISMLPEELPNYAGITAVDVASLPDSTTLLYDNSPVTPAASPAFLIKYCEATDPAGALNGGLPMKVQPSDCPTLLSEGIHCYCGNIIYLGWIWPEAAQNIWEHSLINLDDEAPDACTPPADNSPAAMPPAPEGTRAPMSDEDAMAACKEQADYDPTAQHWYYYQQTEDGGQVKMVRHWCPSEWIPQEMWYKYQRYLPRAKNNFPAPPINDFDLMNSFARAEYASSRDNMRELAKSGVFDDWTLGNSAANFFMADQTKKAPRATFNDNDLGNSDARLSPLSPDDVIEKHGKHFLDGWNMNKMHCAGSDCFDGTHHGGKHDNGHQPYDDYGSFKATAPPHSQSLHRNFDSFGNRLVQAELARRDKALHLPSAQQAVARARGAARGEDGAAGVLAQAALATAPAAPPLHAPPSHSHSRSRSRSQSSGSGSGAREEGREAREEAERGPRAPLHPSRQAVEESGEQRHIREEERLEELVGQRRPRQADEGRWGRRASP